MADYFGVSNYASSGVNLGAFSSPATTLSVGAYTTPSTSMFSGLGGMSMAGALSGLVGTFLGTSAQVSAIKSQSQAIIKQIEAEGRNYVFESSMIEQQRKEVARELGDMMTDVGLQGLEAEAKVRAMNAERGVSGSSVDASSLDVAMKMNKANADLISQYNNNDVNLLRRQLAKRVEMENKMSQLASGIASPASAGLSALMGGVSGFSQGYNIGSSRLISDYFSSGK